MKKFFFLSLLFAATTSFAQQVSKTVSTSLQRPKLVVGIVVDQMRWDYLYRYYDRYGNGGFKRMLNGGFSCENTMMNHIPSVTGVGHAIVYSGSVPSINGIAGNEWIEQLTGRRTYCVADTTVLPVGASGAIEGRMSPRNLLVTTIGDELRLATNFRSRVIAVSLKDRASVLPGGHLANAAFWFDDASAHFITSTYYMNELPDWVNAFNNRNRVEKLIENGWNTLYPINTYKASDPDTAFYEGLFPGETNSSFPHKLKEIYARNKNSFRNTPFGNTLTLEFAKEALNAYQLGKGAATDLLTINFASTDYAGHMFGINAIEIEDVYLRLDKDLADLFQTLDAKVGKGQWLAFLTADHGAPSAIGFMKKHGLPSGYWSGRTLIDTLNKVLTQRFQAGPLVLSLNNYQVNFDMNKVYSMKLDYDVIKKAAVEFLQKQPAILYAVDLANIGSASIPQKLKTMMINGYNFKRSGGIQFVLNPGWFDGGRTGTTHGTPHPYDTHVPLIWYGWRVPAGRLNRETYMTDITPTLAALLHVQMPNGSIGDVITELIK